MTIFFSVGEPSGDMHGANLVRALRQRRPHWRFVGYGGPKMAAAGCQLNADLTELAVMWLSRVLMNLHKFILLLIAADRYFRDERPDAVVLIDYPGFNWWVARRAKARGIPVFYYGTPQVWAWASHRVRKMRRYVDHVLCKLPFEEQWFQQRGCNATYVGHPYFDELRRRQVDPHFVAQERAAGGSLVTILPGSRTQEVEANADTFLKAARIILQKAPDVCFVVAAFRPAQARRVEQMAAAAGVPIRIHVGRTPELIEAADYCLACSGSVSLELLYHAKPSVVLYRISRLAYFIQSLFRHVRYITLVNLLTSDNPFTGRPAGVYDPADDRDAHVLIPEYLTWEDRSGALADHILQWMNDPASAEARRRALVDLRDRFAQGGASERAADYIVGALMTGKVPGRAAA